MLYRYDQAEYFNRYKPKIEDGRILAHGMALDAGDLRKGQVVIMNSDEFFQSLEKLNPYEMIGKKYFEKHHRNLSVEQYSY